MPSSPCCKGCTCGKHRGNGAKTGRKRQENPQKVARHDRVRYERGRADSHMCVKCGDSARDWAQIHDSDPLDVYNYQPMCRKCHLLYDRGFDDMSEMMRAMRVGT